MARYALLALVLVGTARQERPVFVHATVISLKTGEKKTLPAGPLDAVAKQIALETTHNQFEILATASVRTEDSTFTKLSLGTSMNLMLTFKPMAASGTTLTDLQLIDETERTVVTVTAQSTVTEKKPNSKVLLATRCSFSDEAPMLVGIVGTGDAAVALVIRVTSK